ncbi:hypothetical protein D9756_008955 [Leucocoprinus leucothites]|uniref:Major facilitator superfamily (MFS) profile domain-containing protein n=1 Tax=Leucocoprinus leucothites TaxID=201217 RepID=A0A8H5CXF9_9AGAR|nr:hypothetical protein D9756_008955 [Leucoagaricus leucothites]
MASQDDQRSASVSELEREPLLSSTSDTTCTKKVQRTRLPYVQLSILLYLIFCQGAASHSIYPFENELLRRFADGDEGKAAYYASIMDACRHFASLVAVLYLSRASDYLGRKPMLILSLVTMAISTFFLGISTTFWAVVASRCLYGLLNNVEATVKTSIGEITDESNRADAFAVLSIPWVLGGTMGSLLSGYLANPAERWPILFNGVHWHKLPYLLPCGVNALLCSIGLLLVCFWFRETLQRRYESSQDSRKLVPIRTLLTPRVVFTTVIDVSYSFFQAAAFALEPLFLGMPISDGGFGLRPAQIGSLLFIYGLISSGVHSLCMGPLVRRFGLRAVTMTACVSFIPMFLLIPLANFFAKDWLMTGNPLSHILMQTFILLLYVCFCLNGFGYLCIPVYITSSAPNKQSLGSINGITQVPALFSKLVGSSFATFLLGLSIRKEWMGGYAVYFVMSFMACGCVVLAARLPRDGWPNV